MWRFIGITLISVNQHPSESKWNTVSFNDATVKNAAMYQPSTLIHIIIIHIIHIIIKTLHFPSQNNTHQ